MSNQTETLRHAELPLDHPLNVCDPESPQYAEALKEYTKKPILEDLRDAARRSFNWISHSPERRGDQVVKDYSEELESDLETIKRAGANEEEIARYTNQYRDKLRSWLYSQGNTASSFVTGGSNFPVARQQKLHRWADNKYADFRNWREKVLNVYKRREKEAKIESLGGPLEMAKTQLANMEATQERYKNINLAYRAYKKNPNSLIDSGLSEADQRLIIQWNPEYSFEKAPIHRWQLSNNLANIKRVRARIAELETREAAKQEGNKEIQFPGGIVIFNTEQDRLQIKHDVKPEQVVIDSLKRNGFRWSPFNKAWQRQLTDNARISASRVLNINI